MRRRWAPALLALVLLLTGCGGSEGHEGQLGETIETYFFDFTVHSASLAEKYADWEAPEGQRLLVVEVSVENPYAESVDMYDMDFWIRWGEEEGQAVYPITVDPDTFASRDTVGTDQLPGIYELPAGQTRRGKLVFEVPEDEEDFSLWNLELFDDGTEEGRRGDFYIVSFSADD